MPRLQKKVTYEVKKQFEILKQIRKWKHESVDSVKFLNIQPTV